MKAPINSELTTNTHVFFLRGVFSNFTATPDLLFDGNLFQTTEQAFMYAKAQLFHSGKSMTAILAETDPSKAKQLGREVPNFNAKVWDENKFDLMYKVNLCKYSQFPAYKNLLLATKDKKLVEANGKDAVWGIGMYADNKHILDESKWKGENLLGEVLMKVRQTLRERIDVEFEQTVYARACKLIESNPEKLTFDQIVQGLNLTPDQVDRNAINLAFGWASQAHVAYLEDN